MIFFITYFARFARCFSFLFFLIGFSAASTIALEASMLSIGAALNRARDTAPELNASYGNVQSQWALYAQAGKLKNPDFNLFIEDIDGSRFYGGWKLSQVTYTLTQEFDIWKKRASRAELAKHEALIAHYNSLIAWQAVRKELVNRFLNVRWLEEKWQIAQEKCLIAQEGLSQIERHIAEGKLAAAILPIEQLRLIRARVELESAERLLKRAQHLLALRMGDSCFEFERLEYAFEELLEPPCSILENYQLQDHPLLSKAQQAVEASRKRVTVEKTALLPNPQILVGFRQRPGLHTYSFVAGVAFPLTLWDRNEAGVSAAKWQLAADEAHFQAAQCQLKEELTERHHALQHAYLEARSYRELLAHAETSYRASHLAFQEGLLSLTDWIQAQHEWFTMRHEVAEFFLKYHQEKEALAHLMEMLVLEMSS